MENIGEKPRIFIDIDGVAADWCKRAIEVIGLDKYETERRLRNGEHIEEVHPEVWEDLNGKHDIFWTELELLPHAKDLVSRMQELGETAFLTSGGNLHKRADQVAEAAKGKMIWAAENFPGVDTIITREKYLCAHPGAVLVDDTKLKIDGFREYGGKAFHWPNQYLLADGTISIEKTLNELESLVKSINPNFKYS